MSRSLIAAFAAFVIAGPALAQTPNAMPGEERVEDYTVSNANAGAAPITDPAVLAAFHGQEGVRRIVDDLVRTNHDDPRISDIFKATDQVRLRRTLFEQFCYILGGGCAYTGRDMRTAHKNMGLQASDMNALVENLQASMRREGVPFAAQNKLLAKLAPQKREMIER